MTDPRHNDPRLALTYLLARAEARLDHHLAALTAATTTGKKGPAYA